MKMLKKRSHKLILMLILLLLLILATWTFRSQIILGIMTATRETDYIVTPTPTDSQNMYNIVIIAGDLSDKDEHIQVMHLNNLLRSYDNISTSIYDSMNDITRQKEFLSGVDSLNTSVVIVNPIVSHQLTKEFRELYSENVSIVTLDSTHNSSYYINLRVPYYEIGEIQADYLLDNLRQDSKISIVIGNSEDYNLKQMRLGFEKSISDDSLIKIEDLSYVSIEIFKSSLDQIMESEAIVVQDSSMLNEILEMMELNAYDGLIVSTSFDNSIINSIMNGNLSACTFVDYKRTNRQALQTILSIFQGEELYKDIHYRFTLLDRENIEEYISKR